MHYAQRTSQPAIIALSEDNQTILAKAVDRFVKLDPVFNIKYYSEFFSLLETIDELISNNMKQIKTKLNISKSQHTVNEIIAYINAHLMESMTLDDIAEHFFMNKDYLGRLFKKHTHATIGHYISMQKLSQAQHLLSQGQSVAQVYEHLGFSSYAYFFKFFKKMTGISPSQYRKNNIR